MNARSTICKLVISLITATLLTLANQAMADAPTETLVRQDIPQHFELEATIEAVNQSTVSAQTSGAVKVILFDVNDTVAKGALLIEIDNTQQLATLAQAKASLAQAQAQNEDAQVLLKRNQRLFRQGTLSQGELDSTSARAKSSAAAVEAASAGVRQASEQLAYTQVRAPYSGVVKARHIAPGELVTPGTPLMTGLSLDRLRAIADLPQRLAEQYQSQQQISIRINNRLIKPAKVTLFPYADSQLHSVRIRADLPADGPPQIPGSWAKMLFKTGERQVITVPATAVIQRSELSAVYINDRGAIKLRQIRTGNRYGSRIEVLSGLQEGDTVFTSGYATLAKLKRKQLPAEQP